MVLQDTWVFHGTIFENIAYGRENAAMEEVVAAAKAAQGFADTNSVYRRGENHPERFSPFLRGRILQTGRGSPGALKPFVLIGSERR